MHTIHLIPPIISPAHIDQKIVCIRSHRERIFQVSTQIAHDKLIFHNYGHGGAGWTFLFGCVHESVRQFEQQVHINPILKKKSIIVIGAGCYGLLTALILSFKGYTVRIVAKELDNISSYKAAGFFFPRARKSSTPEERSLFAARGMESYATYLHIAQGSHPFITQGASLLPCYFGPDIDPGFSSYIEQGLVEQPKKVMISFGNNKQYTVMDYKTIFINAPIMMQELHHAINKQNISIEKKAVDNFGDLDATIIFNCSGQGAKQLTADPRLVPVQGHLITLKHQPDMSHLQYMVNVKGIQTSPLGLQRDELIYYAPKEQGILGITFIRGQDSTTANHHEFDRLLQRCQDFFGT